MIDEARVLVDLQPVQSETHGERGIARWVTELSCALERSSRRSVVSGYVVDRNRPLPPHLEDVIDPARRIDADDVDRPPVLLVTSPFEGLPLDRILPPGARGSATSRIVFAYDLIPLRFPAEYLRSPSERLHHSTRLQLVRDADLVLTISEQSAADLVDLGGVDRRRIRVVGGGASEVFCAPADPHEAMRTVRGRTAIHRPFLLVPVAADWRKNPGGALRAYALLEDRHRRSHQLAFVGRLPSGGERALRTEAAQLGVDGEIVFTGVVDEALLLALYQAATCLVFPTIFEGLGLPAIEALRCGTPALVSDNSALREIVLDPSARFDPHDVDDAARTIARHLDDPAACQRLVDACSERWTWTAMAEEVLDAVQTVAGRRDPTANA